MYVYATGACLVSVEARRGWWLPRNWSYRWLWITDAANRILCTVTSALSRWGTPQSPVSLWCWSSILLSVCGCTSLHSGPQWIMILPSTPPQHLLSFNSWLQSWGWGGRESLSSSNLHFPLQLRISNSLKYTLANVFLLWQSAYLLEWVDSFKVLIFVDLYVWGISVYLMCGWQTFHSICRFPSRWLFFLYRSSYNPTCYHCFLYY